MGPVDPTGPSDIQLFPSFTCSLSALSDSTYEYLIYQGGKYCYIIQPSSNIWYK